MRISQSSAILINIMRTHYKCRTLVECLSVARHFRSECAANYTKTGEEDYNKDVFDYDLFIIEISNFLESINDPFHKHSVYCNGRT